MASRRPTKLHEETVRSLSRYLVVVRTFWAKWFAADDPRLTPWFRGHGDAAWPLVPGRYRADAAKTDESDFRHEFRLRAFPFLGDATYPPRTDWDWYFLMQHYGVPTRLLDWSESALVGLYFAVVDQPKADGVVWLLDPYILNIRVARVSYLPPYDARTATRYLARVWRRANLPPSPIAIDPPHNSRRLVAQSGKFTVHGSSAKALEDYRSLHSALARIVIPKNAKAALERELAIAGIREHVVFPDLSGLGRGIRREWTKSPLAR